MRPLDAGHEAVASAYADCERIARHHYENFPVASILLPAAMRPHISAIYAFARAADDFADEGDRSPADRLALLDDWSNRLTACASVSSETRPSPEPRVQSPGLPAPCPMPLNPSR